ncbi:B-cell receptor CD22-like [Synchiropus splendidus]|uniref:B-cell receptor CD22-like n=1 Tax=Synchiropus splendidus TaxID=270530 RepID=UPI00237EBB9A|nr:B-cell receptor CD22-like [Synchiropus splendidus]
MMRGRWLPLLLVLTPGVVSDWGVSYGSQCAVRGSSIVIKCSYDYAPGDIVTSVEWFKGLRHTLRKVALPLGSGKYEYAGNYEGNCDLKIRNIRYTDEGSYFFSFSTTVNRRSSPHSSHLSVTDLTAVLEPSTVTEGERVSLTCRSGCPSSSGQVWFKDGKPFSGSNFRASRESSGRYHCALSSVEGATSVSVELNVLYAPLNVVLRKVSTEDTVKGSSVTLSCSSDANPPVSLDGYSMYKDNHWISSGPSLTIPVLELRHSGRYHCRAWNNVSREGEATVASADVDLDVKYTPVNVVLRKISTEDTVKGSSVTLSCSSDANPPVSPDGYSMYKDERWISSGPSLTIPVLEPRHSGRYHCRAWNNVSRAGEATVASADVDLDVKYTPVNVVLRKISTEDTVKGSSVTLSCSSDANPPVSPDGYSMYKDERWISSGPSLTIPVLEPRHSGRYHCRAWNNVSRAGEATVASADVDLDVKCECLI